MRSPLTSPRPRFLAILAFLLCADLSPAAVRPKFGGQLVRGYLGQIHTLDPLKATTVVEREIGRQVHAGSVRFDRSGKPIPDLAESLLVSEDRASLRVRFRPGLVFHDGRPLAAIDLMKSLERWRREQPTGPAAILLGAEGLAARATLVDELTLSFAVDGDPQLALGTLADPRAAILPAGEPGEALKAVGAGPFALAAADTDLALAPFTRFPRGRPYLDRLIYRAYSDSNALILAHRFKGVEALSVPAPFRQEGERLSPSQLIELPRAETAYLQFHTAVPPFSLAAARELVDGIIDRRALIDVVLRNEAEPALGFLKERPAFLDPGMKTPPAPAGAPVKERRLSLIHLRDDALAMVAERVQVDLHGRGFEVELRPLDRASFHAALETGSYDLALRLALGGEASPAVELLELLAELGSEEPASAGAPPLRPSSDLASSLALEARRLADRPVVFLFHRSRYLVFGPRLRDVEVGRDGVARFETAWKMP